MDDVLLVRGFNPIDQLLNDGLSVFEIQRAAQVLAFYILHDKIVRPNVVQMADVGMVESRNCTRFASKPLGELGVRDFDRYITIQPGIMGTINLTHPAFTDRRKNLVRAEFVTYGERHVLDSIQFS